MPPRVTATAYDRTSWAVDVRCTKCEVCALRRKIAAQFAQNCTVHTVPGTGTVKCTISPLDYIQKQIGYIAVVKCLVHNHDLTKSEKKVDDFYMEVKTVSLDETEGRKTIHKLERRVQMLENNFSSMMKPVLVVSAVTFISFFYNRI